MKGPLIAKLIYQVLTLDSKRKRKLAENQLKERSLTTKNKPSEWTPSYRYRR